MAMKLEDRMRLAEALQERADLSKKIEQLRSRLQQNAVVQEGEEPAESPQELLGALDKAIERLAYLIYHINLTNVQSLVDGKSLTELLAEKDSLVLQISVYRSLLDAAGRLASRASRTEIKVVSAVNVREIQKKSDDLSAKLRKLDCTIQEMNWKTDLL